MVALRIPVVSTGLMKLGKTKVPKLDFRCRDGSRGERAGVRCGFPGLQCLGDVAGRVPDTECEGGTGATGKAIAGLPDSRMAVNAWRPALLALGLFSLVGCVGFGPLEIKVKPRDLTRSLPSIGTVTHTAYFSSFRKLIDECGPGMESVEEAYERRIADMVDPDKIMWAYNETIEPVIEEAMVRCLEQRRHLVPEECRHRMITVGSSYTRGHDGAVALQCGESAILPLELGIEEFAAVGAIKSFQEKATHIAYYSNLDKLLDECGPGAKKARDIAFQSDDHLWDAFGRIVDHALVECLKKRNLIPEACRHIMTPLHDAPVRSFEPKVHFRCGGSAKGASSQLPLKYSQAFD